MTSDTDLAALQVLAYGVRQANSIDAAQVSEAIRAATVETPIGSLAYEDNGDLRDAALFIFQVRDGAFVQVYPK